MDIPQSEAPAGASQGGALERRPKCYAYVRASTYRQVLSPEDQEKRMVKEYKSTIAPKDIEWGGVIFDKATTSGIPLDERKGGSSLIEQLQPFDHILITDVDRMFRDWEEAVHWVEHWRKKQQIVLHIVCMGIDTSTSLGAFFVGAMAYFGQVERQMLRDRTARAMQLAIIRGKVSEADMMTLTDFNASFPARIAGRYVFIRSGTGQGQRRLIRQVTEQTLRITEPWEIVPDATSAYRVVKRPDAPLNGKVGPGFRMEGKPGHRRVVADEEEQKIMVVIVHKREIERLSFERIHWFLREDGIRTRDGTVWSRSRIQRAYRVAKKL